MDDLKIQIMHAIGNGQPVSKLSRWKMRSAGFFRVGEWTVHAREVSGPNPDGKSYPFSVYASTLGRASMEVWICSPDDYYLVPMQKIGDMYRYASQDRTHPEARNMIIYTNNHRCYYGSKRQREDFTRYFRARLDSAGPPDLALDIDV